MKQYNKEKERSSPRAGKTRHSILLETAANFMYSYLKNNSWKVVEREDGTISKIPLCKRGNSIYAYYQSKRYNSIQSVLSDLHYTDGETVSNSLFVTLTGAFNRQSEEDINNSWDRISKALSRFVVSMRGKKGEMKEYVAVLEAHRSGGCHAHIHIILKENEKIYPYVTREGKLVYVIKGRLYDKIKKLWAKALGVDREKAHCDIKAIPYQNSDKATEYIMKELGKVNSCEQAVKNYRSGKATESEEKRILAYYFGIKHKLRLLRVSKGLSKDLSAVPDTDTDLISISNKSQLSPVVHTLILRKQDINLYFKGEEFLPYTGKVESKRELEVYRVLFAGLPVVIKVDV